jgi:hypothetical protein
MFQQGFTDGGGLQNVVQSIPIIGGILSGLMSLFGFGSGWQDALKGTLDWAGRAFTGLGDWIHNIFSWALDALKKVASFVTHNLVHFFKSIFTGMFHLIDKLHNWLEAKLGPVVRFLKKMKAWYDRYYKLYVRPYLNMLQHIRQVLGVLRALHIHWAAELDRRVLQIESYTAGMFSQVRTILNGFIDIFNTIIDPKSIIRKPILVLSARRTFLAMTRLYTGRPPGYFFPSPRRGAGKGLGFMPANMDFADPAANPPTSAYLGEDDGIGLFDGFMAGQVPDNSSVDGAQPLDYFDDGMYPAGSCTDPVSCLEAMWQRNAAAVKGE